MKRCIQTIALLALLTSCEQAEQQPRDLGECGGPFAIDRDIQVQDALELLDAFDVRSTRRLRCRDVCELMQGASRVYLDSCHLDFDQVVKRDESPVYPAEFIGTLACAGDFALFCE